MFRLGWLGALAMVLLLGASSCGLDEPIPSPHATALVSPTTQSGTSYLFVSNRFLDVVYRINPDTLAVKEIPVGKKPRNLAVHPDGTLVAVANEAGKSISLIEVVSLRVQTIRTGYTPRDVRFSPDGRWIGVANFENETISIIDAETGLQWDRWVGGGPVALDFDNSSRYLAVACYHEDAVKVVDLQTKNIAYEWMDTEILRPQAISFGRAGTAGEGLLFVGCRQDPYETNHESYADSIAVLHLEDGWPENSDTVPDMDLIRSGPNPRGFLWNHEGDRLLAINHVFDEWENTYQVDTISMLRVESRLPIEEETRFVTERNPVAAVLSPVENLIAVANKDGGSISFFDLQTLAAKHIPVSSYPYALAFNHDGTQVVVVHESPLMPVSVVDFRAGTSRLVYDSLSMDRWIE